MTVAEPTDEEMVAITTAAAVLLTAPTVVEVPDDTPTRWRFSGRWWSKPIPLRRRRPY